MSELMIGRKLLNNFLPQNWLVWYGNYEDLWCAFSVLLKCKTLWKANWGFSDIGRMMSLLRKCNTSLTDTFMLISSSRNRLNENLLQTVRWRWRAPDTMLGCCESALGAYSWTPCVELRSAKKVTIFAIDQGNKKRPTIVLFIYGSWVIVR